MKNLDTPLIIAILLSKKNCLTFIYTHTPKKKEKRKKDSLPLDVFDIFP